MKVLILLLALFVTFDDDKDKGKQGTFALTNATIETVTSGTIENGTVVISMDRIVAVGASVTIPDGAEVIDCSGMTIFPGLIDSGTLLGLKEVGSDPRTMDFNEVGDLNPQLEALTAVNPNTVLIPVNRVNGVTSALAVPRGGLLPGVAALINLHGYTPQQMSVGGARAMVIEFPRSTRRGFFDRRKQEDIDKDYKKNLKQLNDVWNQAKIYARILNADTDEERSPEYEPELAALASVVNGEIPALIEVNSSADIRNAIKWVEEQELTNVIFSGVSEGWRVAQEIAKAEIPVVVGPVLSTPTRQSDRYDKPYANAGLLHKAGVQVAIRTQDAENVRNLPYNAGFAAAYGMGREAALAAVTIEPARIFGVDHLIGSIDEGKVANLFVADGDPFETKTKVQHLFIDGYKIPLTNRHRSLFEEFLERNPGLEKGTLGN